MNWAERVTTILEQLLSFAEHHRLIEKVDRPYYRNLLLDVMQLDAPEGEFAAENEIPATATVYLQQLLQDGSYSFSPIHIQTPHLLFIP